MKALVVLLKLTIVGAAFAGDYTLFVSNSSDLDCLSPIAAAGDSNNPVATGDAVAKDILRHFRGERPRVPLLEAAFANGHIEFCGAEERTRVYQSLVAVTAVPRVSNEEHLYDYAFMIGDSELLELVKVASATPSLGAPRRSRLEKLADAVRRGMDARSD